MSHLLRGRIMRHKAAPLVRSGGGCRSPRFLAIAIVAVVFAIGWLRGGTQAAEGSLVALATTFNSPLPPQAPSTAGYIPYTRTTQPLQGKPLASAKPDTSDTEAPADTSLTHKVYLPVMARPWEMVKPGFGGGPGAELVAGIADYVYYGWGPFCDYPDHHGLPMIWGAQDFYTDTADLDALFNGPCNDTRPLLFLNEPAQRSQANTSPEKAADMFYAMTRGDAQLWPRARWRGPIYVGNNLIEDQSWEAQFVQAFASKYNQGNRRIAEVAGWGVHLYGNFEYGPYAGSSSHAWTQDIPASDIPTVVGRSISLVQQFVDARAAEGNSTLLLVTEFGLLQQSTWYSPPTLLYNTTSAFMQEYVGRFDQNSNVQSWFWFVSSGGPSDIYDTDFLFKSDGSLTPNGTMWRTLALPRQTGGV